jgi:hypothetical protein
MPEIAHTTREVLEVLSKADEPMTTKDIYGATSFGSLEQLCKCLCAMRQRLYVERTVNNDRKNLYTIAAKGQRALGLRVHDLIDEEDDSPGFSRYVVEVAASGEERVLPGFVPELSEESPRIKHEGAEMLTKRAIREILPVPLLPQGTSDVEVVLFYLRSDGILVIETVSHGNLHIGRAHELIEYLAKFS